MAIDDRTGLPIQEGSLQRRILRDVSYADFFEENLFDTYFNYARDAGRVIDHNEGLYERSLVGSVGERPTYSGYGSTRQRAAQNRRAQEQYRGRVSEWNRENPDRNLDGTLKTGTRSWYGSYVPGLSPTDRVNK